MRALALAMCLSLAAASVSAQEATPVAEVAAGYSLLNTDGDVWSGWTGAGSVTLTRWFAIAAEVGMNYYSERYVGFDGREYEFRADTLFAGLGPRFVARSPRVAAFGQLLVGVENEFFQMLQQYTAGRMHETLGPTRRTR